MLISNQFTLEESATLYDVSTHTPGEGAGTGNWDETNNALIEAVAVLKKKYPGKFHTKHTLHTRYFFNQPLPHADGKTIPMAGFLRPASEELLARLVPPVSETRMTIHKIG